MTLFCTTCVENSASVALVARPFTMTSLRARGAIVSTYLSVLVTVLMAHTDRTDTGIRMDASTMSTHAEIRRGRCPRRVLDCLDLRDLGRLRRRFRIHLCPGIGLACVVGLHLGFSIAHLRPLIRHFLGESDWCARISRVYD